MNPSQLRGATLQPGTVVVLSIDGTLALVEELTKTHAGVVPLPEQVTGYKAQFFTPGRVGLKKISPFALADRVVAVEDLTVGNREFLDTFKNLREEKGPNFVVGGAPIIDPPVPTSAKKLDREARTAAKVQARADKQAAKIAAKQQKMTARYLRLCGQCGEQPGHPKHPDDHVFVEPVPTATSPAASTSAPESNPVRVPRAPRAAGGAGSTSTITVRWIGDDTKCSILAAGNPKFKDSNSGGVMLAALKGGAVNVDAVIDALEQTKYAAVPRERVEFAFKQLLAAQILEVVA